MELLDIKSNYSYGYNLIGARTYMNNLFPKPFKVTLNHVKVYTHLNDWQYPISVLRNDAPLGADPTKKLAYN